MKLSVCIPVYNGENYIAETIQSVLSQNWKDYELLIVDNHSTDGTLAEVEKFADSRIRLIKNDRNYGMFENWNICLRNAQGEYIQLLCADDFIEPGCLTAKVGMLEKQPDVVLVFSASNVVDTYGKTIVKRRPFHNNLICDGSRMAKKSFHRGNIYGEPTNVMFRKNAVEKAGEFIDSLSYSGDWDYWMRLSIQGKTAYIDRCLTNFRISSSSETTRLIRQIRKMQQDDKLFRKRSRKIAGFSAMDMLVHCMMIYARLVAKVIFCLGVNKR